LNSVSTPIALELEFTTRIQQTTLRSSKIFNLSLGSQIEINQEVSEVTTFLDKSTKVGLDDYNNFVDVIIKNPRDDTKILQAYLTAIKITSLNNYTNINVTLNNASEMRKLSASTLNASGIIVNPMISIRLI
jgi:hypothetical protein